MSGSRGGIVYHVTLLDKNYSDTRAGTLGYGLTDSNFTVNGQVQPRTTVFDVAGTFWLGRFGAEKNHDNGWDTQLRLNLGSNVTIAGQTAPGPVYIMGGVVKAGGTNAILRNSVERRLQLARSTWVAARFRHRPYRKALQVNSISLAERCMPASLISTSWTTAERVDVRLGHRIFLGQGVG